MGMAALAAATEPSMIEQARAEGGSADPEAACPISILIMAVGRSVSTMVGELFHQNKVRILRDKRKNDSSLLLVPCVIMIELHEMASCLLI